MVTARTPYTQYRPQQRGFLPRRYFYRLYIYFVRVGVLCSVALFAPGPQTYLPRLRPAL